MSGSFDYRSFAKFANNFNRNANHAKVDRFMRQTLNYEGTELKSNVKERTPIGLSSLPKMANTSNFGQVLMVNKAEPCKKAGLKAVLKYLDGLISRKFITRSTMAHTLSTGIRQSMAALFQGNFSFIKRLKILKVIWRNVSMISMMAL